MKAKRHTSCTVLRTFERQYGKLDVTTGVVAIHRIEVVTEPCNKPLFSEHETATGICNSCRKGWEVEKNSFASVAERQRATEQISCNIPSLQPVQSKTYST